LAVHKKLKRKFRIKGVGVGLFEPFIELIYDTLISVMTKVNPRNLMEAIIFFQKNLEQNLELSKFEYFFAVTRIKPVFHHDMDICYW
jgi:hypothetical protein